MAGQRRVGDLARLAAGLAAAAGTDLPDSLALWELNGGRVHSAPVLAPDPAQCLGEALEASLTVSERQRGAHYTPAAVADRVAGLALDGATRRPRVVDPACGGGAVLLAAGRALAATGLAPQDVARDLLWGADIDPLAAAVTEAALALWSGGTAPAWGHIVAGDTLDGGAAVWADPPAGGFDAVVGNPPFQGQLARATARSPAEATRLRAQYATAVTPYVDTAALFLLAAAALVRDGGRVALVQPLSTVASRDAGGVRAAITQRARLVELWAPSGRLFDANVRVCVPVLEVGDGGGDDWAGRLATARGVPEVELRGAGTVGDGAAVVAGFRDEYYGLVGHVREASGAPTAPLVTCGLIGLGTSAWGAAPVRFAKQRWERPDVDVASATAGSSRIAAWLAQVRRPKVIVASQTRVIEAAVDAVGTSVPSTPALSVIPSDPAQLDRLAAVLCAPPVAVWAARRAAGTGLSPDAIRVSAAMLSAVPLPTSAAAWSEATALLAEGALDAYGAAATAMYDLPAEQAAAVECWWAARRPR